MKPMKGLGGHLVKVQDGNVEWLHPVMGFSRVMVGVEVQTPWGPCSSLVETDCLKSSDSMAMITGLGHVPLSCPSPYLFVAGPNTNWTHLTKCLPNIKMEPWWSAINMFMSGRCISLQTAHDLALVNNLIVFSSSILSTPKTYCADNIWLLHNLFKQPNSIFWYNLSWYWDWMPLFTVSN